MDAGAEVEKEQSGESENDRNSFSGAGPDEKFRSQICICLQGTCTVITRQKARKNCVPVV